MCRALPNGDDEDDDFLQMGRVLQVYRSRLFEMGLQAVKGVLILPLLLPPHPLNIVYCKKK